MPETGNGVIEYGTLSTLIIGWVVLLVASFERLNAPAKLGSERRDIYDLIIPVYLKKSHLLLTAILSYSLVITVIFLLGCIVLQFIIVDSLGFLPELNGGNSTGSTIGIEHQPNALSPTWLSDLNNFAGKPFESMNPTIPLITSLALIGFGEGIPILSAGDYYARKLAHRSIGIPHAIRDLADSIRHQNISRIPEIHPCLDDLLEKHVEDDIIRGKIRNELDSLGEDERNRIFSILYWQDVLDDHLSCRSRWLPIQSRSLFPSIWREIEDFSVQYIRNFDRKYVRQMMKDDIIDETLEKSAFLVAFDVHHAKMCDSNFQNTIPQYLSFLKSYPTDERTPIFFVTLLALSITVVVTASSIIVGMIVKSFNIDSSLPTNTQDLIHWSSSTFLTYFCSIIAVFWFSPNELKGHLSMEKFHIEKVAKIIMSGLFGCICGFYLFDSLETLLSGDYSILPSDMFYNIMPFSIIGILSIVFLISSPYRNFSSFKDFSKVTLKRIGLAFVTFFTVGFLPILIFQVIIISKEPATHWDIALLLFVPIIIGLEGATLAIGLQFYRAKNLSACLKDSFGWLEHDHHDAPPDDRTAPPAN